MALPYAHHVLAALPNPKLFSFPPTGQVAPIAPAPTPFSIMRPFNIPDQAFAAALDARVPLTLAILYAVMAKVLSKYNRSRNKRPWSISKTRPFFAFVVLHNILLAVYSAWTFWGMLGGMRRSFRNPMGPGGLPSTVDSLCRLHGPGHLGSSIYYNEVAGRWQSADAAVMLNGLDAGLPSSTHMGRMWNEGLAYYGWIFYLSKFYEVLDTFIILAKGKPSSILQTYHHAGAMMCMWAGMRYMSAPIWMFVLINSFIHSLMYSYYTLTAFSIKVPMGVKRMLTTMQITQFLVGASFAMAHSFITYVAPVSITRRGPSMAASPADSTIPVASGVFGSVKKLLFGPALHDGAPVHVAPVQQSPTVMETTYVAQPCIVTTGETFAIWLNVLYLAPLTYLFVSFFIASYVKRSNAAHKTDGKTLRRESNVTLAEKAGWDAARGVEREFCGSGGDSGTSSPTSPVANDGEPVPRRAKGRPKRRA